MIFEHPEVATRPCDECRLFVFDERGEKATRGGQPIRRPPGASPPCKACPKKSPREAHRYELSPRNLRLVSCFMRRRATGDIPMDEATRERFSVIDAIVRRNERTSLARSIAAELLPLLVKGK